MAVLSSGANIELIGLFRHSYRGDSRGVEVFARLGIETEYTEEGIRSRKSGSCVERLDEDSVDIPDLAQMFATTCALPDVPFQFAGLQSLKIKETDRIEALKTEMKKLGYMLHDEDDNVLYWNGERIGSQAYPVIKTYEDHRMAMALAPAATHYPTIQIDEPQVVSGSYPGYWDDLRKAGFVIETHATETSSRQQGLGQIQKTDHPIPFLLSSGRQTQKAGYRDVSSPIIEHLPKPIPGKSKPYLRKAPTPGDRMQ